MSDSAAPASPAPIARGPATSFVQRITGSAPSKPTPPAPKLSFGGAAGSMLGDVVIGAPTSAAIGVGYAKGVVTKPRLLAAAGAAATLAIGTAPYFPTLSAAFRRMANAGIHAAAFIAGFELGGGVRERAAETQVESIAEVDAEL